MGGLLAPSIPESLACRSSEPLLFDSQISLSGVCIGRWSNVELDDGLLKEGIATNPDAC